MISPVVIFLAVLVQLSSTVAVTKPAELKEPQKVLNKTSDRTEGKFFGKFIPILTDILCEACSNINNTKELSDCKKKQCTRSGKSQETLSREKAFEKHVMGMHSDKEGSDAKTLISADSDMLCKLCSDIKNTTESNDCRKKNCPVSKPGVTSVNLGTEELSPIS